MENIHRDQNNHNHNQSLSPNLKRKDPYVNTPASIPPTKGAVKNIQIYSQCPDTRAGPKDLQRLDQDFKIIYECMLKGLAGLIEHPSTPNNAVKKGSINFNKFNNC